MALTGSPSRKWKRQARERGLVIVAVALGVEDYEKLRAFSRREKSSVAKTIRGTIDHCLDGHHWSNPENANPKYTHHDDEEIEEFLRRK